MSTHQHPIKRMSSSPGGTPIQRAGRPRIINATRKIVAEPERGRRHVRGEQADGELVRVTPMWITYTSK